MLVVWIYATKNNYQNICNETFYLYDSNLNKTVIILAMIKIGFMFEVQVSIFYKVYISNISLHHVKTALITNSWPSRYLEILLS